MSIPTRESVDPALYERDETAWLDQMAELARDGRVEDFDLPHLAEYLADMANRDRREIESRIIVLMIRLLKWTHQPRRRSRSWVRTILEQHAEIARLTRSRFLRNHAKSELESYYPEAVRRAAAEMGVAGASLPDACPYTLESLLAIEAADYTLPAF